MKAVWIGPWAGLLTRLCEMNEQPHGNSLQVILC